MSRSLSAKYKQTSRDTSRELLFDERLLPALRHLLRAYDYARDVGRDRWDFSVELVELRRLGLRHADCRWLMCKNWVELAREIPPRADGVRRFHRKLGLSLGKRTCVTLSLSGASVIRTVVQQGKKPAARAIPVLDRNADHRPLPHWDNQRRELRVGETLIKRYRLPSPNQLAILLALEEEGWPPRIDDPLKTVPNLDAKQRLHDTIKNLNRRQRHRCLRFFGDGTGQGICWEWLTTEPPAIEQIGSASRPRPR